MQYLGGKERVSKDLCAFLESVRKPNQQFTDLTVGGLSIIAKMERPKKGYDIHRELIEFYQQISTYPEMLEELPEQISKDEYYEYKTHTKQSWYNPFVEFGCSYSGSGFAKGYARSRNGTRNYALSAKNSLRRKFKDLYGIEFGHKDLFDYEAEGELIYIDPPYTNTTKYRAVKDFNYDGFWDKVRELSKNNDVYVSEYEAPNDFKCVWKKEKRMGLRTKKGGQEIRVEKVFTKED